MDPRGLESSATGSAGPAIYGMVQRGELTSVRASNAIRMVVEPPGGPGGVVLISPCRPLGDAVESSS